MGEWVVSVRGLAGGLMGRCHRNGCWKVTSAVLRDWGS